MEKVEHFFCTSQILFYAVSYLLVKKKFIDIFLQEADMRGVKHDLVLSFATTTNKAPLSASGSLQPLSSSLLSS